MMRWRDDCIRVTTADTIESSFFDDNGIDGIACQTSIVSAVPVDGTKSYFDVRADFSMDIEVGEEIFTKKPSILEEIAYRDTWGRAQMASSP